MEVILKLSRKHISRIQTRAEAVVYLGRSRGLSWADGACESDVFATIDFTMDNGSVQTRSLRGTYMYLGTGRGYLDLGLLGQWRIGHETLMTRGVAERNAGVCLYEQLNLWGKPVRAAVVMLRDPGAIAYLTDHLIGEVLYGN